MLGVKVRLCTVRARKFAVRVLLGDLCLRRGRSGGGRSRSAGCAGQDTSATLGANNVRRLVALLHERWLGHHGALRVRRIQPALGHHTTGGHWSQDRRDTAAGGRSRGNGLRVRGGDRGLGHHGRRGRVGLLRLLVGVVHHGILLSGGSLLRWRRGVAAHRVGSVGSCRRARRVRVARVHRHGRIVVKRRQSLGLPVLQVVGRGDGRGRGVRSRARVIDHVRGVVVVVVHNPTRCLPRCDERSGSIRIRLWWLIKLGSDNSRRDGKGEG